MEYKIVGSTEANSLKGKISNESPVGKALIGAKVGDVVTVNAGVYAYYGADRYNSNGSIASYDANFSLFRNEAISKALNQHSDWSIFDNDGNGSVDMVFFIYAG